MSTTTEDPRRARSRTKVLSAAVALLREEGHQGLTIEAVAARSGVAKTTIYRHFADREDLHVAALEAAAPELPMPVTDDLLADVTTFCTAMNSKLWHSEFGPLLATAIDGGERSASLAAILTGVGAQRRKVLADRLEAARRCGTLPADVDLEMLHGQLVGVLFYRRFMSRQATGPAFVAAHVQATLSPLVVPARPATSGDGGARTRSGR